MTEGCYIGRVGLSYATKECDAKVEQPEDGRTGSAKKDNFPKETLSDVLAVFPKRPLTPDNKERRESCEGCDNTIDSRNARLHHEPSCDYGQAPREQFPAELSVLAHEAPVVFSDAAFHDCCHGFRI
jgi:hypothetical protein